MGSYTKNIAVIKGLKEGFSADGGPLSGLVRTEKYGSGLRVEVSLINFAPLSEGRYAVALSDGNAAVMVEGGLFEGTSDLDTSQGFAAVVFFINGGVFPVASAVCGNFHAAALGLKEFAEKYEGAPARVSTGGVAADNAGGGSADGALKSGEYEDEAIAEENYYEYPETDKDGGAVREDTQKEENGRAPVQDAAASCAVEEEQGGIANISPLARGAFYEKMKSEIEGLLSAYPVEEALCRTVENSKWVRISYGDGMYYVFGVIYSDGVPQYVCYGVPTDNPDRPPESMAGLAGFIPYSADDASKGYWVMYQDANTGASLRIDFE